jgi:two-component system chemotaxis response regulator CheY
MAKTLLIVDDEASMRKLYSRVFSSGGYAVSMAASLAEAMELAAANAFDLIITDFNLGDGEGTELIRELKKSGRPAKVVLISGSLTGEELLETAARHGIQACFEKPFNSEELIRTVSALLA